MDITPQCNCQSRISGYGLEFVFTLMMLLMSAWHLPSAEATQLQISSQSNDIDLNIALHKSKIINLNAPIKKVTVGNPNIVDMVVLDRTKLYLVGKALGTTNILIIGDNGNLAESINIEVGHDLLSLKRSLHDLIPDEQINVYSSQGSIVLSGTVTSIANLEAALDLARSYLPLSLGPEDSKGGEELEGNQVINLLRVGGAQQVMLEVSVAEVSRELMKKMDINFHFINSQSNIQAGAVNGGASFPDLLVSTPTPVLGPSGFRIPVFPNPNNAGSRSTVGPVVREFSPNNNPISDKGFFLNFLDDNYVFNAVLDIAKENGLAKILAEPTLTTLTGQKASFISGGEFPIPVPMGDDGIGIEFKEFGVQLSFLPTVLDERNINLDIDVSVSDLLSSNSVVVGSVDSNTSFFVPSLSKRSVQTTVELLDGETLGIAGMISETLRETINKVPWVGDIPILGALFRSQEFIKGQTELVIFVTPYFANTIDKSKITLPFDDFIEPTDSEFFLFGKMQGEAKGKQPHYGSSSSNGGFIGAVGHQVGLQ